MPCDNNLIEIFSLPFTVDESFGEDSVLFKLYFLCKQTLLYWNRYCCHPLVMKGMYGGGLHLCELSFYFGTKGEINCFKCNIIFFKTSEVCQHDTSGVLNNRRQEV